MAGDLVVLEGGVEGEIRRHGEEAYPGECCGLLLGKVSAGQIEVVKVLRGRNGAEPGRVADRYVIDPADVLAAMKEAEREGLDIVGVYHSHPDHPAVASATDAALAWAGWVYVIVSVMKGRADSLRGWRVAAEGMVEVGVVEKDERGKTKDER